MTLGQLVHDYADEKIDAIEAIRTLTGIINPDYAIDILALVNQITRVEQRDLDRETLKSLYLKGPG